jgi:hypothetical protein
MATTEQLDRLQELTWIMARARMVTILVQNGLVEVSPEGNAGFYRGDEWVSIYDLFGELNENN